MYSNLSRYGDPADMDEREILEVDVLVVGSGVAGLSCAIHMLDLIKRKKRSESSKDEDPPSILVLEKGPNVGAHILSGAVLDPRALNELMPDWAEQGAPIKQKVTEEEVAWLSRKGKTRLPGILIPPYMHNDGNYVVSLAEVAQWLGEKAQEREIEILEGVGGASMLYEGDNVVGVRCGDSGVEKDGSQGANYMPGTDIRAKVTVLAEGVRGSLTKQLVKHNRLDANRHPQTYATGVKEVWEVPAGTFPPGKVLHTLGFPLQHGLFSLAPDAFGGSFVYGLDETHIVIGLVVGLDCEDPFMDPHNEFNRLKQHPKIRGLIENGKIISYGAKAIPEGGYYAMPCFYGGGFVIVGDSAGFLNAARLKGAHLAMKSGMLAAEAIVDALTANDFSAEKLGRFEDLFQSSWACEELRRVRNWRAGYAQGLISGGIHDLAQRLTGGRGFSDPLSVKADHELTSFSSRLHGKDAKPVRVEADGKLTFDKVSDVFHSGSVHGESQPSHLVVPDQDLCSSRCTEEYGNPCQHFCPAAVYEWVPAKTDGDGEGEGASKGQLQINFGNCVHCKTCDIKDPYQNIEWCVPEGGDGPRYQRM